MAKGNGSRARDDDPVERYRAKLRIDRHELDEALMEHPALYLEIQEAFIDAASLRDERKIAVEESYAVADSKLRRAYEKNEEKYTETRIKSEIAVDEGYLESVASFQEAKKRADLLNAMVQAFQERGRMLGKLADLYISGYWAQSTARGSSADLRDRKAEEGRAAMAAQRRTRIER